MLNNQNQTPTAMADVGIFSFLSIPRGIQCCFVQNLDTELRHAQTEFDRQLEMTRLLLDGLNHSHVRIQV